MELKVENMFDLPRPLVIAGPCSAETEQQVLHTACELSKFGVKVFRAGVWKPRTMPGHFEGVGSVGLSWLRRVACKTGMAVMTEVANAHHVEACLEAGIHGLWIGARTTSNPFAVQEIADALRGTDVALLVKNPVSPELALWIGALERLQRAGIGRLAAVHRGFPSYADTQFRNMPHWDIPIELRRRCPELPLLCDPSHMGGRRELITTLCQQAMDLGADGLMVECHCHPERAWSDARQQITPEQLQQILKNLVIRSPQQGLMDIDLLRKQIDECDEQIMELLAKRMDLSREIGVYKKKNNMTVLQTDRYQQMLTQRVGLGHSLQLDDALVEHLFALIHEESVRRQMEYFANGQ
ncbi:MAG: chorismate mutase [Bacteroidales bacterium]|nr:chorismate mutase [Bacteroidales bacterium]